MKEPNISPIIIKIGFKNRNSNNVNKKGIINK